MPHTEWVLSAFVITCCSPSPPVADSEMNTFNSDVLWITLNWFCKTNSSVRRYFFSLKYNLTLTPHFLSCFLCEEKMSLRNWKATHTGTQGRVHLLCSDSQASNTLLSLCQLTWIIYFFLSKSGINTVSALYIHPPELKRKRENKFSKSGLQ